jgi:two-component system response regulator GlrR
VETIKQHSTTTSRVPVLLCIQHPVLDADEELLLTSVDDFILTPLNLKGLCLRIARLERDFAESCAELEQIKTNLVSHFGMRKFVGASPSFLALIEKLPRVSTCDATVLLTGETGTGKEMCARAIHYLSARANKPFIAINCGSVPAELFENELFGHHPGAFTDARQFQRGLVAEAEGGTLFLDEVNSLAPVTQAKLLRFLQDQQYKPLGASTSFQANVRLIAASNQNLQQLVRERTFREDLYYRLNTVTLRVPTLNERRDDINLLASHFLTVAASEYRRPAARLSRDAIQKLVAYRWPGNVRELENVIRQAVVMSDGPIINAHHLQLSSDLAIHVSPTNESFKAAKARVVEVFERNYLNEVLAACDGNISKAAREAKKNRRTFFALLKKHGLTSAAYSSAA